MDEEKEEVIKYDLTKKNFKKYHQIIHFIDIINTYCVCTWHSIKHDYVKFGSCIFDICILY